MAKELQMKLDVNWDPLVDAAKNIGKGAVESFKKNFTRAWDSLKDEERKQAGDLLVEIGRLRLLEVSGADVKESLEVLNDALLQWKAVASFEANESFKAVAADVMEIGGKFVSSALRGLLRF